MRSAGRIVGLLLVLLCGLSFPGAAWAAPGSKPTVLMVQWRGETPAERGFMDELRRHVPGVAFETFNADQDKDRLLDYLHQVFVRKTRTFDYVYSFGTTASEMVRRVMFAVETKGVVHVINIVADPVAARLADSLASAGENRIVGCHMVPLETQLRNALKIVPFKRMGIIFNPREENSNIQLRQATDLSVRMGFTVVPIRIRPEPGDLENALHRVGTGKIEVDAIYLLSESFLVSNAPWVVKRLNAARIPTIAAVEQYMQEGALTGTIASYQKLGQLVARTVAKDIKSRLATNRWPVVLDPNPEFQVSTSTADTLGIKLEGTKVAGLKYLR